MPRCVLNALPVTMRTGCLSRNSVPLVPRVSTAASQKTCCVWARTCPASSARAGGTTPTRERIRRRPARNATLENTVETQGQRTSWSV